jgi:putative SOS response-associated peptidase YedK
MAGRYALTATPAVLRQRFGYADEADFPPRANIAPSQPVAVILHRDGARRFQLMRWGFLASFMTEAPLPLIFAIRSETARARPTFRAAFLRRRCLMPADGYYAWQSRERPFLVRRQDRAPFAFAALHETYVGGDGGEIDTVGLLTTEAGSGLAGLGPRCPVMLAAGDEAGWLDPATPLEAAQALCRAPDEDGLEIVPLGPAVNRAQQSGFEIQTPVGPVLRLGARAPSRQGDLF